MSDTAAQIPATIDPFDESTWSAEPAQTQAAAATTPPDTGAAKPEEPVVEAPINADEVETFDEKVYVKNKFGWEDPELGVKELQELRSFKEKPFEFANEDSRKAFDYLKDGKEEELFSVLEQKRRINKLLTAETVDKDTAAQIVKIGMKQKNPNLDADDVDFLFNKKFSIPAKPLQDTIETDEDYAVRVSQWESSSKEIERELVIEAKNAKPELEKLKSELVLPDIRKDNATRTEAANQEELEGVKQARERYLAALDKDYGSFNGFAATYKDEEVEFPVAYQPTEEEKIALKNKLSDFDRIEYFNNRWFPDGKPDMKKNMNDIYILENFDKILQKAVSEAGNKRLAEFIKSKKNIDLTTQTTGTFQPEQKDSMERMREHFFN